MNCYAGEERLDDDQCISAEVSEDRAVLSFLEGQSIPLTNIIESFFSDSSLVLLAKNRFEPTEFNKVGFDLAVKWVKNSSGRIFDDRRRSFLEVVLNACDSYDQEDDESVGKFGMGFFSMFRFTTYEETDGASIVVETCYQAQDQNRYAYKITLSHEDGKISVHFESLPDTIFEGKTGTKISVLPKNSDKNFLESTLLSLKSYMYYLNFLKKAHIFLKFKSSVGERVVDEHIGESSIGNQNQVVCEILPERLSVQDFGSGIPIDVALTKLLVPSSSTKMANLEDMIRKQERLLSENIPIVRFVTAKCKKEKTPHMLIGVNDVVVVEVDTEDTTLGDRDVLLSMPQITKLTLARNEISFYQDGGFEERYIKKIIRTTLESLLLEGGQTDGQLLAVFYQGLKMWEEESMADIRGLFTSYFKEELQAILDENGHIIPVPAKYYDSFKCILKDNKDIVILPIDGDLINYNYIILETFLDNYLKVGDGAFQEVFRETMQKAASSKLISAFHLFFVDDDCLQQTTNKAKPVISSFGLKRYLFVPRTILEEIYNKGSYNFEERVTNQIISLATEYDLVPYGDSVENVFFIGSNLGVFNENLFYEWEWFNDPKNDAFFTAEKSFNFFSEKDGAVLEEFFDKYRDIILEQNIMKFIIPIRSMVSVGDDTHQFLHSEEFSNDIVVKLFLSGPSTSTNNLYQRRDFYYIFYNENEKDFFVSSLGLDTFESLGCNMEYSDCARVSKYGSCISDYYVSSFKEKDDEDNLLEACGIELLGCNPGLYQWEGFLMAEAERNKSGKSGLSVDKMEDLLRMINPNEKRECLLERLSRNRHKINAGRYGVFNKEEQRFVHKTKSEFFDLVLEKMETMKDMRALGTAAENIRKYLIGHGKTIKMHNFMNNLFGSLILSYSDNKEITDDGRDVIFINGKQIWPIKGKLTVEKLEELFRTLMYHYLSRGDKNYESAKDYRIYSDLNEYYDKLGVLELDRGLPAFVLSSPESSGKELRDLNDWFQSNVLDWVVPREETLRRALPGLNITPAILDLFRWYDKDKRERRLNDDTMHLVLQLQDTTFGFYSRYFNIPEKSFHRDYGSGRYIHIIDPKRDVKNEDNVCELIAYLQNYPNLLNKLFYFQIADFKFQTDTGLRDSDIDGREFYVPSMLANTPISVLTMLLEKNVDREIIHDIIDEVKTPEELMFVAYTILTSDFYSYCQFDRTHVDTV